MFIRAASFLLAYAVLLPGFAAAQTVLLYSNDFESPNVPIVVNCGNSLDNRTINELYGTPDFSFQQQFTVEAVQLDDPQGLYDNPSGLGGLYAVGMLATAQEDRLALTFDGQGRDFINVGMLLSSIDVQGCGGPFGTDVPIVQLTLYDSPDGFSFANPGTMLDQGTITGTAAPDAFSFAWQFGVVGLDATQASTGTITVVFDLLQSGYAVFDDLSVTAADESGIVDRDTDGIADDTDNCPDDSNPEQEDQDEDGVGDVCDPAPDDPNQCGDQDGDTMDDCAAVDAGMVDAGAEPDAGTPADVGADVVVDPPTSNDDCSCRSTNADGGMPWAMLGLLIFGALVRRRL